MFLDFLEKREETTDSITLTDEEKIFLKVFGIDSEQPAAAMREATYFTCIKQLSEAVAKTPVETWEDYHKCWCDVKSLYGKELYSALEAKLENVVNFETRFCLKLEALNTKEYRVKWGERMFNIIAADYGKYNRRKIVIKAQEIV